MLQEDITILNVYAPNNSVSKYMRQNLIKLKEELDGSTIIVGDFSMPLSELDRSRRQNIHKIEVELKSTVNQLDKIDIYRLLHPVTAEHTFFSSSHGTVTKIDHILGQLNKLKRIGIVQCLISDHNGIKLEINDRKIAGKSQNTED